MTGAPGVTLRVGEPRDIAALTRLAALDQARPLRSPVIVADVDGRPLAAISLADCAVIADPYQPTAALVELLQARVRQLGAGCSGRRPRGVRAWIGRRAPALG